MGREKEVGEGIRGNELMKPNGEKHTGGEGRGDSGWTSGGR